MKWLLWREDRYVPPPVYPHPLPVMVTFVGEASLDDDIVNSRQRSDLMALELVLAGEMMLTQAGVTSIIPAGDLFVLKEGVPHSYAPSKGSHVEKLFLQLTGPVAAALVPELPDRISPTDRALVRRLFADIIRTSRARKRGCELNLSSLAYELLARLFVDSRGQPSSEARLPESVQRAMRFMLDRLTQNPSIEEIAAFAGVSPPHLHRLFRRHLGGSAKVWFREQQMEYAKRLLCEEGSSCKRVALELGFRDPLYFSVAFKRQTGDAPSRWRRSTGVSR